jgi:hypothetical protein
MNTYISAAELDGLVNRIKTTGFSLAASHADWLAKALHESLKVAG